MGLIGIMTQRNKYKYLLNYCMGWKIPLDPQRAISLEALSGPRRIFGPLQ